MDSRRLIIFILLSLGLLFLWEKYYAVKPDSTKVPAVSTASVSNNQIGNEQGLTKADGKNILITTDLLQVGINTLGGNVNSLALLAHGSQDDIKQPYQLLLDSDKRVFIAQSGLIVSDTTVGLPTAKSLYSTDKLNYVLQPNQDKLTVSLTASQVNGINVIKTYTFTRNSYIIDIGYQIVNNTDKPLNGISAYWRLLRDEQAPSGEVKFANTFTGPVYYTTEAKFNTIKFGDLAKKDVSYPDMVNNGWVGFIQHYFSAMWLLNAYNMNPVCANGIQCRLNFKMVGDLASAGLLTDLPVIQAHSTYSVNVPLFAGPEEYSVLVKTAPHLELIKDYGWVYIFATPLFWLLVKLFDLIHNWGWAIILLTLVVKTVLYPLTRASYISMAKMKALAPKMENLRSQYANDKTKLQHAMMELYKSERVNPIGGCLPMILQIPVFIGLYWALLSSVELRQAHFLWIQDLSRPDPYYILPVVLAVTMFLQTFLNPPPADPVQAKMMRFMPLAFSVMFFFFPAGLVLYWLINNILSMAQQWYVNNHVTLRRQNRQNKKK